MFCKEQSSGGGDRMILRQDCQLRVIQGGIITYGREKKDLKKYFHVQTGGTESLQTSALLLCRVAVVQHRVSAQIRCVNAQMHLHTQLIACI